MTKSILGLFQKAVLNMRGFITSTEPEVLDMQDHILSSLNEKTGLSWENGYPGEIRVFVHSCFNFNEAQQKAEWLRDQFTTDKFNAVENFNEIRINADDLQEIGIFSSKDEPVSMLS